MKSKKSLVIIVILSVLLLSLIGYVVYDKLYAKDNEIIEEEKEVISKQLVDSLYDNLLVGKYENKKFGFYYDKKVTIDDIPDNELLRFIATEYSIEKGLRFNVYNNVHFDSTKAKYYHYDDEEDKKVFDSDDSNSKSIVSKTELEKLIKEKFNVDRTINVKDGLTVYLSPNTTQRAHYKASNKSFYFYDMKNDAINWSYVGRKFLNYKVSGDNLYIYDKAVVCCDYYGCAKSYTNYDDSDVIFNYDEEILFNYNNQEEKMNNYVKNYNVEDSIFEWDIDKIINDFDVNTFKHTFKKDSNGYYYWYSTEIDNNVK